MGKTWVCRRVAEPATYIWAPLLLFSERGKGKGEKLGPLAKELAAAPQRAKPRGQPCPEVLLPQLPPPAPRGAGTLDTCAVVHPFQPLPAGSMESFQPPNWLCGTPRIVGEHRKRLRGLVLNAGAPHSLQQLSPACPSTVELGKHHGAARCTTGETHQRQSKRHSPEFCIAGEKYGFAVHKGKAEQ